MPDTSHVLLVDDDEHIRLAFRMLFREEHVEVVEAVSAGDACRKLQQRPFNLVITDIRLGGQSGVTLCMHIRSTYPDTPVIIITGYPELITDQQAQAFGASFLLFKPLDLDRLRAAIRSCLSERIDPTTRLAHRSTASGGLP